MSSSLYKYILLSSNTYYSCKPFKKFKGAAGKALGWGVLREGAGHPHQHCHCLCRHYHHHHQHCHHLHHHHQHCYSHHHHFNHHHYLFETSRPLPSLGSRSAMFQVLAHPVRQMQSARNCLILGTSGYTFGLSL